jgi:hypothetical protein
MMARPDPTESPRTRTLFVSSNGVGMGHLTRLLAVARRLPETHQTIFLTMSQALSVIHQFGFHAEYLPSHQQTLADIEDWNNWLAIELTEFFDRFSIGGVVFDGNLVFPGLAEAVAARARCPLIWIRRGMWREDQDNSPSLLSGETADLIIEPDDVASELDTGVTAELRGEVQVVNPIRLLDDDEVLSRDESFRKLGLDPDRRYVLIQLGSGNNANVADLIGSVIAALDGSKVQPVIAEWLTSLRPVATSTAAELLSDQPLLRGLRFHGQRRGLQLLQRAHRVRRSVDPGAQPQPVDGRPTSPSRVRQPARGRPPPRARRFFQSRRRIERDHEQRPPAIDARPMPAHRQTERGS